MDESPYLLKQKIQAEARSLGFSACGAVGVEEAEEAVVRRYEAWVGAGECDGMDYMRRYADVRRSPARLMPGAKTMLCLALPYAPACRLPAEVPQIACYAYGEDYHEVMRRRLFRLLERVRALLAPRPVAGRVCVDTAPLFEKYWAARAGLGWIGRNTQLVLPGRGSYHFLGELLLDIPLPPDGPVPPACGGCRRCVDACPAGALRLDAAGQAEGLPARLDARRCLSCRTIEFRGPELPEETREVLGGRIYGCDECQKVCPHNRAVPPSEVAEFALSDDLRGMTLPDWRRLTPEGFRRLFRRSAVRRAGYEGLMRNLRAAFPEDFPAGNPALPPGGGRAQPCPGLLWRYSDGRQPNVSRKHLRK